jgi:hypothetical protein
MLGQILVQAASIQLVSIVHRIKVLKIEVANFNASVEYSVISIRRRLPRSPRTSENSRYAKFARDSGSFPKCPGKGPSGRVNIGNPAPLCWSPWLDSSTEVSSDLNASKDLLAQ